MHYYPVLPELVLMRFLLDHRFAAFRAQSDGHVSKLIHGYCAIAKLRHINIKVNPSQKYLLVESLWLMPC
jgi:hypothetical protein